MKNIDRRTALNRARKVSLGHAVQAEGQPVSVTSRYVVERHVMLATMWAAVANALKDGDPAHDSTDIEDQYRIDTGVDL